MTSLQQQVISHIQAEQQSGPISKAPQCQTRRALSLSMALITTATLSQFQTNPKSRKYSLQQEM